MTSLPDRLLARLASIAVGLDRGGRAAGLLGVGSVGTERERLDAYSDLDFFVLARPSQVAALLDDLSWLEHDACVAYAFRNTPDGYKVLFTDGLYAEFAVFEPAQLRDIPLAGARLVWSAADLPVDPAAWGVSPGPGPHVLSAAERAHRLGEALTNLLVGVRRFARGERLSAQRFVQDYALGNVLALAASVTPAAGSGDPFSLERRFEQRYPAYAAHLPACLPGLARTPQAALAILDLLETLELPGLREAAPLVAQIRREAAAALSTLPH